MEERKAEKKAALEFRCIAQAEASGEVVDPFREVAARWFEKWRVGKVERYARDTEMRLREDVLSRIGDRPIAVIKPPEIAGLIPEIENRGAADVARRALQNTNQIFRYAVAFGLVEQNPAAAFRPADILKRQMTTNFARVENVRIARAFEKDRQLRCVPFCAACSEADGPRLPANQRTDCSAVVGTRSKQKDLERAGRENEVEAPPHCSTFPPGTGVVR